MEIASVQECGCVIHELFAGADDIDHEAYSKWAARGFKPLSKPRPLWEAFPETPSEAEARERAEEKERAKIKRRGRARKGELSDGEAFDLETFQREMERRKVNFGEFRGAIRAGGFKAVHLVAQGPFFLIQGEPQGRNAKTGLVVDDSTWLTLVNKRDRRNRMFLNPTAALVMLQELGVKSVQVDLESWRPNQPTDNERRRPDMAERLQFAHEYAREGSKLEGS